MKVHQRMGMKVVVESLALASPDLAVGAADDLSLAVVQVAYRHRVEHAGSCSEAMPAGLGQGLQMGSINELATRSLSKITSRSAKRRPASVSTMWSR